MRSGLTLFLLKYEKFFPLILFLLFLIITLPGISWGAPDLWNPDELFWRVSKALIGEMRFDETEPDYNYPSLPKYAMYGVAWLVRAAGGSPTAMVVSARLISVLLGGLVVVLIYATTRLVTKNVSIQVTAAFLALSNTALSHNARFAHNDLYLLFFISLALYGAIRYGLWGNRLWLYLAFFSSGCAASSKYTGVSYVPVLALAFLIFNWKALLSDLLRSLETISIGAGLTVLGFVLGTPKALLWMSFYFKRMVPAALRFASYGRGPDSQVGLYGQWGTFQAAVGKPVYYLFLVALLWFVVKLLFNAFTRIPDKENRGKAIIVLLLSIVVFDIPFLMSYNYVPRFFLPFLPMFAVLASLFLEDVTALAKGRGSRFAVPLINTLVALMIALSFLNVLSVAFLFANDARTAAGGFIKTLEPNTILEYTLYPPSIEEDYFARTRNYPIYMIKYPGETVPTNKAYQYNQGEEGLYERGVDYLVADSFTYARFSDEAVCQTNPVECEFFNRLLAGSTDLKLLGTFDYSLPPYLPHITLAAVNPVVKVYRVPR